MKNNTQYYIYRIRNTKNDRSYVGQTTNPKHRWFKCHQSNKKMAPDLERYGADAFEVSILARVSDKELASKLEQHYAEKYECFTKGYNTAHQFRSASGLVRTENSNAKRRNSIQKLVWVYNHHDLATKRVSPAEAVALCLSNEGWHLGRFRRDVEDKGKQLFRLPPLPPQSDEDWFAKEVCNG